MVAGKDPTVIMNAVVPDEPDGYMGRRRRFFITRRAGGAALPALLVAASVVVVLIVIGVSQLLPHQASGQIPLGSGGGGTVSDDNGQAQPDPSGGVSPAVSGSVHPSKSPSVKPSASASGSSAPAPPGAPPTTAAAPPPPFGPVTIEAEAGVLGGAAVSSSCSTCSNGAKVRKVGSGAANAVTVNGINAPVAGAYRLTITYELGEPSRVIYVSVNGAAASTFTLTSNTTNWSAPLTATVSITLAGGANSVKFYNPNSGVYAPDLDRVSFH
jgi:hypothetical protein